jgi:hypothetical protein
MSAKSLPAKPHIARLRETQLGAAKCEAHLTALSNERQFRPEGGVAASIGHYSVDL